MSEDVSPPPIPQTAPRSWTAEQKLDAAIRAPMGPALLRADTEVIVRPGWYQLVTPSAPGTLYNEVICSQVPADEADGVIESVVAACAAEGRPVKWCVGPWTEPADFADRLTRRGFSSWDVRGMAIDTARSLIVPDGVAVEEITAATLEEFVDVMAHGWGLPLAQVSPELEAHASALRASPRRAAFFAARIDGRIVGTTGLLLRGDYAYLVGAQVLDGLRGRGIYRALVAARLTFLAERRITLAVTHAREATSAPILEHLGFETVFRSKCFVLETGKRPTS